MRENKRIILEGEEKKLVWGEKCGRKYLKSFRGVLKF